MTRPFGLGLLPAHAWETRWLSEWFFDILTHASGLVAGENRQALAGPR